MNKNIKELTLLLMYLTSWEEDSFIRDNEDNIKDAKIKTCWKGYDFDIINTLTDEGYLYYSKHTTKSVSLTKEGEKLAQELVQKYLK